MPETVVHFQIRMPPVLHEQLASWAKEDKASLNALIVGILEKAIEQHEKSGTQGVTRPALPVRASSRPQGSCATVGASLAASPRLRSSSWPLEPVRPTRKPSRRSC